MKLWQSTGEFALLLWWPYSCSKCGLIRIISKYHKDALIPGPLLRNVMNMNFSGLKLIWPAGLVLLIDFLLIALSVTICF